MKKLELKKDLTNKLVEYYRTTGCDRYGQISTISARQIAKTDEEMDVLKDIVSVALVGYQYGTYEGIFPWGGFKDKAVENLCREAFMKNPSRNNMNNW
jgi:hypothetical protein